MKKNIYPREKNILSTVKNITHKGSNSQKHVTSEDTRPTIFNPQEARDLDLLKKCILDIY